MTPVYPLLLAGVDLLFGIDTLRALVATLTLNCIFAALTGVPIYFIGRRVFGDSVAAWSGWAWALFPPLLRFPVTWIWETSLSALLFMLILWSALVLAESARTTHWLLFGALGGIAALTNPSVVSIWPFLLVWAILRQRKARPRVLKLATGAAAIVVLCVTPWLVRNYVVFGQFVPPRSNLGMMLFLGNNSEAINSHAFWLDPADDPAEKEKFQRMGEIAFSAEKQRLAWEFIRDNPATFARLCLNRFVFFWQGTSDTLADIWRAAPVGPALQVTSYALLALGGFLGLMLALRQRLQTTTPFALSLFVYPLVYYATSPAVRFRHPLDPVLILLTVFALGRMAPRWMLAKTNPL